MFFATRMANRNILMIIGITRNKIQPLIAVNPLFKHFRQSALNQASNMRNHVIMKDSDLFLEKGYLFNF